MSRAVIIPPCRSLCGSPRLPGDKSISHRRALLSLCVADDVVLENFADGEDCAATLECIARLGKRVLREENRVTLSGVAGFSSGELDCENSGTTARLLAGILAARDGHWTLTGDASLSQRPMERVAVPLRSMGADVATTDGHFPLTITGRPLHGIEYESPVASAQVKSAVLLAALAAEGVTRYREPLRSRDHTERILNLAPGSHGWISLDPKRTRLNGLTLSASIPGDPSAAAFWIAAALLVPGSRLTLRNVLVNPVRAAYLRLLREAGARIEWSGEEIHDGEPVSDVRVEHSAFRAFQIAENDAPALLDELPVLAVLAAFAEGVSNFYGLGELRVKETDRLALITRGLARMGARTAATNDSLTIRGGNVLHGAEIETGGDHRIAMAFAVAALTANGNSVIENADCVGVSDPEFWNEGGRLLPDSVTLES
ncbi:MAG: 3-phosphoshikimate 1-carboxyvinyltransferase [bacterium]|nr:3-phosphoshikimate 1-carboxyvinyltransferase [bacterium]